MTGPISVDLGEVTSATNAGAANAKRVRDLLENKGMSKDPKVLAALRKIADKGKNDADKVGANNRQAGDTARTINSSDDKQAARARALQTILGATGGSGTTQMPQAPSFNPQPMAPVNQMSTVYPPGTVFVTASQLQQLLGGGDDGGSGSNPSSTSPTWNGVARRQPIPVSSVAYEKRVGKMSSAQLDAAINGAMDKTGITDPQARAKWSSVLKHVASYESGYNASAVNTSDSNAVGPTQSDGAPAQSSRGAWQTIPATFASNHAEGTSNNIYDPEASAAAAINYMMTRYNAGKDGSGLDSFVAARPAGAYVGY